MKIIKRLARSLILSSIIIIFAFLLIFYNPWLNLYLALPNAHPAIRLPHWYLIDRKFIDEMNSISLPTQVESLYAKIGLPYCVVVQGKDKKLYYLDNPLISSPSKIKHYIAQGPRRHIIITDALKPVSTDGMIESWTKEVLKSRPIDNNRVYLYWRAGISVAAFWVDENGIVQYRAFLLS